MEKQAFAIREITVAAGGSNLMLVYSDTGNVVDGQTRFEVATLPSGWMTTTVTLQLHNLKMWSGKET